MTPQRSRSVSRDKSFYRPTVAYVLTEVLALRESVIREAVSALLDQHSDYTQQWLKACLSRHYPEIPENLRAPIVVATTARARQAALMHVVWEKTWTPLIWASNDLQLRPLVRYRCKLWACCQCIAQVVCT